MKCFIKTLPEQSNKLLPELKVVKPVINSVSFHHYGKEFSITVTGDNLWFCNKVKVGSFTQSVDADDISQKSLQFNHKDISQFPSTSDQISVKTWSQFSSPVSNNKVAVKRKVSILWKDASYSMAILLHFSNHFLF